jgi:DNA-binding transcriptional MocR family regulator
VIYCSSLSKTLAPGWRIGWIAAGRYHSAVLQARMAGEWAGAPLIEAAANEILASGDYDRHLRHLKLRIAEGMRAIITRVEACFHRHARRGSGSRLFDLGTTPPG